MWSDMRYGWCADALLKSHVSRYPNTPVSTCTFLDTGLYTKFFHYGWVNCNGYNNVVLIVSSTL